MSYAKYSNVLEVIMKQLLYLKEELPPPGLKYYITIGQSSDRQVGSSEIGFGVCTIISRIPASSTILACENEFMKTRSMVW